VKRDHVDALIRLTLFAVAAAGLLYFGQHNPFAQPDDWIHNALTRGSSQMALEQPVANEADTFLIDDYSSQQWGFNVAATTAIPAIPGVHEGKRVSVDLTPAEWAPLDSLRRTWCVQPPPSLKRREDAAYVLGLRCSRLGSVRIWYLPKEQLPPELLQIAQRMERAVEEQRATPE
jgi:hypothetical protein